MVKRSGVPPEASQLLKELLSDPLLGVPNGSSKNILPGRSVLALLALSAPAASQPWKQKSQQTAVRDSDPELDAFWKVNVESQPCHLDLASLGWLDGIMDYHLR